MRIDGIARTPATRREAGRGWPGEAQFHERFRFSPDGYVLDLTIEAMRRTGRGNIRAARSVPAPPRSYNQAGELAYYDPPAPPMKLETPVEIVATPAPPMVSFVAFDGMLRARAPRRAIQEGEAF